MGIIAWFWRTVPPSLHGPMTWIGHGLVGLGLGLALDLYGAGFAAGMYGWKEYLESDCLKMIKRDNVMDWMCPVIGGLLGAWIR